jgi:serine/threonine protein kinase
MVMSLFADEFAEKTVKKYINEGIWLNCNLSDYYMYLEYYDDGGYGTIHKVMDRSNGEYLILKRSSKKDFVEGCLEPYFNSIETIKEVNVLTINHCLKASKEAEFMVKIYSKLGGIAMCDYYDDDDHYILVMEDGGRSLESISCSHRKKIIDLVRYEAYQSNFFYRTYLKQIIGYMIKIYHKVKSIHDLGIHHNDLKPENILIHEDEVTIIDYGVAKSVEESYENYKGTLEYIPYEFVETGSYKPWDHTIWCFGVMLHFLTLMKYPFLKEEDVLEYNLNYKKINKLPQSFSDLIYDCLQKDPINRPQNLLERLQNLETFKIF